MEIQPIVIGTAGHIDHGKSTLVRRLTGIDPDRLKEEQERGMTIDLGFANFALPDGRRVGIVDVPGHERFVRNMVAGASGIDLVLLVVAADDGVMPQTREHLAIMELLGVSLGLIALTKVDMTEPEMVELAEEDVRESVRGTFLEGAPILRVSSVTGEGLDELAAHLMRLAADAPPRPAEGVFRMPVQRVFSARGFGTILTGIPVSGSVGRGDLLEVLPVGLRGKVRGLQAYHQPAERARAGHSTAINLTDVDHTRVERGCVVATPGYFTPTRMLAARLRVLAGQGRSVTNRMPIRLHTGTVEALGEVIVLDLPEIAPGEEGLVQLRLAEPVVAAPGDRFVLRLASPLETLGGGVVLEPSAHRLKRFKAFVLEDLELQSRGLGTPLERLSVTLARAGTRLVPLDELCRVAQRTAAETEALLSELEAGGVALRAPRGFLSVEARAAAQARLREGLASWFDEHPWRSVVDLRDLRSRVSLDPDLFELCLGWGVAAGELERLPGGRVRPMGREGALSPEQAELLESLATLLEAAGLQPPDQEELAAAQGRAASEVQAVLEVLEDQGRIVRVGKGLWVARGSLERARAAVVANCERHGQLEIPELRDELDTTRKFLIPLLEYFDAQGVTLRQGGHRVLKRT